MDYRNILKGLFNFQAISLTVVIMLVIAAGIFLRMNADGSAEVDTILNNRNSSSHFLLDYSSAGFNNSLETNNIDTIKDVPILMFHSIRYKADRYSITPAQFLEVLQMLYDNNFFVISAADFEIKNFSNVPAGKNPVVLTFDDGRPDQFRIIKNGDELCIDPECAVGIMESFFQSHPDFGKGGLFFITFNIPPFMQEEYVKMKLNMLLDMGYEIGNHTCNHYFMDRISYEKAYFEIHNFDIELRKHIGNKVSEVVFFAYPFGNIPVNQAITSIIRNKFKLAFGVNTIAANVEKTLTKNRFNVDRIDARPEKVMKYAIKPVLQK